jgi:ribosomal protein S19E (S16A)
MKRIRKVDLSQSLRTLTANEEVTLRRVAYGQSDMRSLRRSDIAQLYNLRLVQDGKDGPELTAAGRRRFDALPRAVIHSLEERSLARVLAEMSKAEGKPRR